MPKNKLFRFSEMDTFPNVIQATIGEVLNNDYKLKGKWKQDYFKNENPIILEVGCGKGEYTVALAEKYPDKTFFGLDIKGNRMYIGAKYALENNLDNVRFFRTRIEFVNSIFGKDEVDEIWITFPDPQMKKGRARKRLTHPLFLNRYLQILKPGGLVHLKTDSQFLYDFTQEVLAENKDFEKLFATNDLYSGDITKLEPEIQEILDTTTFYENMFLAKGMPITYTRFRKK